MATANVAVKTQYRDTNLFPANPVYIGPDYLGDDPDPSNSCAIWVPTTAVSD